MKKQLIGAALVAFGGLAAPAAQAGSDQELVQICEKVFAAIQSGDQSQIIPYFPEQLYQQAPQRHARSFQKKVDKMKKRNGFSHSYREVRDMDTPPKFLSDLGASQYKLVDFDAVDGDGQKYLANCGFAFIDGHWKLVRTPF
ncbi:hypothetical protein [Gallaecimonas sp. GXIMD4217]|uniref:hypothetical protein n=1 Tax=Gallaecimonas sp. GXIMD4217 TaxID=3131927 RepID=UPI00311AE0CA